MTRLFCRRNWVLLAVLWLAMLSARGADTQTLSLTAGWNWVGFNVLPETKTVSAVLGNDGFTANDRVQGQLCQATFSGRDWQLPDMPIAIGSMVQMYVSKDMTVTVSGKAFTVTTVPLKAGWNWIANPTAQSVSPADLTFSGGFSVNDVIMGSGSQVTYSSTGWVPSSGFELEPGKGYKIYVAQAGILQFPLPDPEDDTKYAVVDLSAGAEAVSYPVRYSATGPDLNDDTCRTTELWLRKIPAGTFMMGSPEDEVGRDSDETQHEVTLTKDYYIGVFECTQKQWELVMGSNPSQYQGDGRPVECVSYDMIRGTEPTAGAGWPAYDHTVDLSSFMGRLQSKTGLTFDLPTEAQWEYACRAGTTTALNSGKNLTNIDSDVAMDEVGRYVKNRFNSKEDYSEHTKVGCYQPNTWGLYDMHGNAWEWCLDWYTSYSNDTLIDPIGPQTGSYRVFRGGSWQWDASTNRSATRSYSGSSYLNGNSCSFRVALLPQQDLYAVVDLSAGAEAVSYPVRYSATGPDLNDDTCRTTELWLRKIPAGTFTMGSPDDEVGRYDNEGPQHQVTLTKDYYIGVFECTQKQWELVMGSNPSTYKGDCRPVEYVTYDNIRGSNDGAGWPAHNNVDASSFMGKIRSRTGLTFDLPTEAEWEYACRAGTTTALNSGRNLTNIESDDAMEEVGRYKYNQTDGMGGYSEHAKVGSYMPNAWGLYDMHGNVWEWCLDWYGSYSSNAVTNPVGPASGPNRMIRGSSWGSPAKGCRSANRSYLDTPSNRYSYGGFRLAAKK